MRTALLLTGLLALGLAAPQGEAALGEAALGEAGQGEAAQGEGPVAGDQQAGEEIEAVETIMEVEGVQEDNASVEEDAGKGEEEDDEMEEEAESEDMPSVAVESLGAAAAQLDDKETKKCERCLKKGFYKRHMDFCDSKCDFIAEEDLAMENVVQDVVENIGDITTTRKPTLSKEEKLRKRCERCSKKRFYKNNKEYCDVKCDHESTTIIADIVVDDVLKGENMEEGDDTVISEEKERKKKNSSKKKKQKNKTTTNIGEKNKKIKKKPEPSKKLGPLENLIKYLIRRNTLRQ
jgi:hypothetical protein